MILNYMVNMHQQNRSMRIQILNRLFGILLMVKIVKAFYLNECLVSLFSFGHTGAGKSHTLFGNKEKQLGFLPLILESLFAYIYQVRLL